MILADVNLYFPGVNYYILTYLGNVLNSPFLYKKVENFRQTFTEIFEGLKEEDRLPNLTIDLTRLTDIDFTALKVQI